MHDFRSYIFAARIASDSGPTCTLSAPSAHMYVVRRNSKAMQRASIQNAYGQSVSHSEKQDHPYSAQLDAVLHIHVKRCIMFVVGPSERHVPSRTRHRRCAPAAAWHLLRGGIVALRTHSAAATLTIHNPR